MTCGATIKLPGTKKTLTCGLDDNHDGPVHDDDGHQWGDITLPMAHARDPESQT